MTRYEISYALESQIVPIAWKKLDAEFEAATVLGNGVRNCEST